ncbi:MAG TPA: FtsX-like permease family protein, partial [Oscillatoriaceae cyanobacterium]
GQSTRIILRNLQRQPRRALVALVGLMFATAITVVGTFSVDAIDRVMAIQFDHVQRYDAAVTFVKPRPSETLDDLRRLPGVLAVEGFRSTPVRLYAGARMRLTSLTGLPAVPRLDRVVDAQTLEPLRFGHHGLALDDRLASELGVRRGDALDVEVLEGKRPRRTLRIAQVFHDDFGTSAYLEAGALDRLLDEGRAYSGAYLRVDPAARSALVARCARLPMVAGVQLRSTIKANFDQAMAQSFRIERVFSACFAGVIAFGVVYNSARIILSERARELATLRIIGFSPREVSYILVGELALLTAIAIPSGLALGVGLADAMAHAVNSDLMRLPAVVAPRTLVMGAAIIVIATVFSAWSVARGLARLDLVSVLKTKE